MVNNERQQTIRIEKTREYASKLFCSCRLQSKIRPWSPETGANSQLGGKRGDPKLALKKKIRPPEAPRHAEFTTLPATEIR